MAPKPRRVDLSRCDNLGGDFRSPPYFFPSTLLIQVGLAGAFNTSILRKATDFFKTVSAPVKLIAYGKKANQIFGKRGYDIVDFYSAPSAGAQLPDAVAMTRKARELFESGEVDEVYVVYSKFISAIRQIPQTVQLLLIEAPQVDGVSAGGEVEFEPSADVVLDTLLP